ncbi:MAG: TIM barrel protein [Candidatus Aminicenantes bacterium]|nr:TIM barrel protein [Candidatus Aminicenantes bacterium]
MSRRTFIGAAAASLASLSMNPLKARASRRSGGQNSARFQMKYAPSLGFFREHAGKEPLDHVRFAADQGFRAVFDNGLMNKAPDLQEKIAAELSRRDMDLGPFVAYADFRVESFVLDKKEVRQMLKQKMMSAVETAKRTHAKWTLVVPGRYNQRMEWDYQTANVIENLKYCADICAPAGLIMVIEPLNPWDHPGLFLKHMPQAYQICRAVNSSFCKIVDDVYHQQISEGNLIPNIDRSWSEIASFHLGDNPGRKEPGTGEINFKNIFKHLHKKGYEGTLCMEHGKSIPGKEGEKAVIKAYRACDSF